MNPDTRHGTGTEQYLVVYMHGTVWEICAVGVVQYSTVCKSVQMILYASPVTAVCDRAAISDAELSSHQFQ